MNPILLGDLSALLITTLIGFITHGEADLSFLPRFFAILIPLITFWLLLAPRFKLFQPEIASVISQLWRVPLAMLFVAPLAVVVRSIILQTSIAPMFILAFGATSTIGLLIWRGVYIFTHRKK